MAARCDWSIFIEVKGLQVAFALGEMDLEDLAAGITAGQVDEEDFIESPLAHEFGRQGLDVVGGGDDKDGLVVVLHPGQQLAEHALLSWLPGR